MLSFIPKERRHVVFRYNHVQFVYLIPNSLKEPTGSPEHQPGPRDGPQGAKARNQLTIVSIYMEKSLHKLKKKIKIFGPVWCRGNKVFIKNFFIRRQLTFII